MNELFARYVTHVGGRAKAAARLSISRAMVDHVLTGIRPVTVKIAQRLVADPENPGLTLHALRPDIWQEPRKVA